MLQPRRIILWIMLAAVVVLLDQAAKAWVLSALSPGQSIPAFGPVRFTLALNHSNAFGLAPVIGEATRWALVGLNLGAALALAYFVWSRPTDRFAAIAAACIAGGALGNALDRARLGVVVDFVDLSPLGFIWVFNLADVAIDVGIGFWLLSAVTAGRQAADRARET